METQNTPFLIAALIICITLIIITFLLRNKITSQKKTINILLSRIQNSDSMIIKQKEKLDRAKNEIKETNSELRNVAKILEEVREETRVSKGNATRFKNRCKKQKFILKSHETLLLSLGQKFEGIKEITDENNELVTACIYEHSQEDNSEDNSSESPTPSLEIVCQCMKPIKGLGGNCKSCRKPIK